MNLDEIATRAGVSRMTVSRVLRNHNHVSQATRERVMRIASELGYRPNPMVSVLMSQVAQSRKATYQPTLIYAWEHSSIQTKESLENSRGSHLRAVRKRAGEVGFQVDAMRIDEPGMTHRRYSEILVARNIPGLIIAPSEAPESSYDFDWNAFPAVTFGYSVRSPQLSRVTLNYHAGIFNAMKVLWERGFRRFGLVITKKTDDRILHLWSSGFLTFHWEQGFPNVPNILVLEQIDEKAFSDWFRGTRPEVIFAYNDSEIVEWTRQIEGRIKKASRCKFVHLDQDFIHHPENLYGAIESCRSQLAEAAVDMLVTKIKHNESGLPERQKNISIEPEMILMGE